MRTTAELREGFLSFFEERGHLRCPSYSLVPRAGDDSTLLVTAGMQPQMPFFLGQEPPPALLTTLSQKVLPNRRHRRGRPRRAPPHVLRDARQLLVRAVLQGRRDRVRDASSCREHMKLDWDRVWVTVHAGDPAAEARPRRGRDRALAEGRDAGGADRPAADVGELLVRRRSRAVWAGLGDLLRLGRGARLRRAGLRAGVHALRSLPRVLEPRVHGVRAARRRHAHAAPEGEHRHRPRPRARRGDPAGRHVRLRHRRLSPDHGLDRRRSRASRTATRRRPRRPTGSWPTTDVG